jgi:DNA-binding Lrp family transcriptional regulator
VLDDIDLATLAELTADARITNAALAARIGVAESTSIKRLRALRDASVLAGFTAQLNLAALGFPIQAVIKVRLSSHNRDHVLQFHATLTKIPGVLTAFHVVGEDDYLLHVMAKSPEELRDLVLNHINVHRGVQHTETQLVFGVLHGVGAPFDTRKTNTKSGSPRPPGPAQARPQQLSSVPVSTVSKRAGTTTPRSR